VLQDSCDGKCKQFCKKIGNKQGLNLGEEEARDSGRACISHESWSTVSWTALANALLHRCNAHFVVVVVVDTIQENRTAEIQKWLVS
jgi:hypothetical protein